jgi:hypothetical protein
MRVPTFGSSVVHIVRQRIRSHRRDVRIRAQIEDGIEESTASYLVHPHSPLCAFAKKHGWDIDASACPGGTQAPQRLSYSPGHGSQKGVNSRRQLGNFTIPLRQVRGQSRNLIIPLRDLNAKSSDFAL